VYEEENDGDYEQHVKDATQRVCRHHSQNPEQNAQKYEKEQHRAPPHRANAGALPPRTVIRD
jgi:hypothetical protein